MSGVNTDPNVIAEDENPVVTLDDESTLRSAAEDEPAVTSAVEDGEEDGEGEGEEPISFEDARDRLLQALDGLGIETQEEDGNSVDPSVVDPTDLQEDDGEEDGEGEAIVEGEGEGEEDTEPSSEGNPQLADALQRLVQTMQGTVEQSEGDVNQQLTQDPPASLGEQPAQEPTAISNDEFIENFNEDPVGSIKSLIESIVPGTIDPIVQELQPMRNAAKEFRNQEEIQNVMGTFAKENPEFAEHGDTVLTYISENGLSPLDKNSYKLGLAEAKLNSKADLKSLDEYLSDEDALAKLASDERVSKKAVEEYLKGLDKGGTPATIGADAGNSPSAVPPRKARTIKEASEMLKQDLRRQ